jgi:hypothetical protein
MILKLVLLSISLMALAFAGLGIKILAKKDGEFAGTCASQNPHLVKQGVDCGCGGAGSCENE